MEGEDENFYKILEGLSDQERNSLGSCANGLGQLSSSPQPPRSSQPATMGGGEDELVSSTNRKRQYPENFKGPYTVFIRESGTSIRHLEISRYLHGKYKSITSLNKVGRSKLRVMLGDIGEANQVPHDEKLKIYRVYIPAKSVEVDGVIHLPDGTDASTLIKVGSGKFRASALSRLKILDAFRFSRAIMVDGKKTVRQAAYMRVTFPGLVLPDYVDLDGLLIPVAICRAKVMICDRCLKYGHTDKYCSNKQRCAKCGESHTEKECRTDSFKCPNCGANHTRVAECSVLREIKSVRDRKTKTRLGLSYAQAVKSMGQFNFQVDPKPGTSGTSTMANHYSLLGQDDDDDDDDNDDQTDWNRPLKANFKKSRSSSAKKTVGNNKGPVRDNSDELDVINRVEKPAKRRRTGSPVGNLRQEKTEIQPQQRKQERRKQRQQQQTQPPKRIPTGRGQRRSSGSLGSSGPSPIGGAVRMLCEAFGLAPALKTLLLTAIVPLLDQHWPSISTFLNLLLNGANSHG
jgi:hypothetical protein